MSLPSPVALHEMCGRELAELLDKIVAGEAPAVVMDQATAELQEQHRVDERGRCAVCWPLPPTWWRP